MISDRKIITESEREFLRGRVMSLDLGKMNDHTAIAILEYKDIRRIMAYEDDPLKNWMTTDKRFICRYLYRFRLGTTYTEVAERVNELLLKLTIKPEFRADPEIKPELVIDGTGVGEGVFEIFLNRGLKPKKIVITGGSTVNKISMGWHVPKRELVSAITGSLERKELVIPDDVDFKEILLAEMESFQIKVTPSGHDSYSHREGEHDDLLLSVAQAVWYLKRNKELKAVPALAYR